MLKRHRIFNQIIAYWVANGRSSTPRPGELRRLLRLDGMKMARQTLNVHLSALEADRLITLDKRVIVLIRKEPMSDAEAEPCASDAS